MQLQKKKEVSLCLTYFGRSLSPQTLQVVDNKRKGTPLLLEYSQIRIIFNCYGLLSSATTHVTDRFKSSSLINEGVQFWEKRQLLVHKFLLFHSSFRSTFQFFRGFRYPQRFDFELLPTMFSILFAIILKCSLDTSVVYFHFQLSRKELLGLSKMRTYSLEIFCLQTKCNWWNNLRNSLNYLYWGS